MIRGLHRRHTIKIPSRARSPRKRAMAKAKEQRPLDEGDAYAYVMRPHTSHVLAGRPTWGRFVHTHHTNHRRSHRSGGGGLETRNLSGVLYLSGGVHIAFVAARVKYDRYGSMLGRSGERLTFAETEGMKE